MQLVLPHPALHGGPTPVIGELTPVMPRLPRPSFKPFGQRLAVILGQRLASALDRYHVIAKAAISVSVSVMASVIVSGSGVVAVDQGRWARAKRP